MSLSEYLEYIEKVDRDIRKLPSYRGRPQPTDRGTLFTYMLDGLHPDTQANCSSTTISRLRATTI